MKLFRSSHILAMLTMCALTSSASAQLIIAHRGASYLAPEEARPAFLVARELGGDYLEFDIQRTKDVVLIAPPR